MHMVVQLWQQHKMHGLCRDLWHLSGIADMQVLPSSAPFSSFQMHALASVCAKACIASACTADTRSGIVHVAKHLS